MALVASLDWLIRFDEIEPLYGNATFLPVRSNDQDMQWF